ncbi:MAG: hypothetical protein ABI692_15270 [Terracoccus sp.]
MTGVRVSAGTGLSHYRGRMDWTKVGLARWRRAREEGPLKMVVRERSVVA